MSRRNTKRATSCVRWPRAIAVHLANTLRRLRGALRRSRYSIPIEVLVADRSRRRLLERELRAGLHRLQRAFSTPLPTHVAVIVQQVIHTDRQLAGCCQVGQRADGSGFALLRLALQVDGRPLESNELLAALAEQYIGLVTQHGGSSSVLVPVELESAPGPRHLSVIRPDPLVPHPDGEGFTRRQRSA